MARDTRIEAIFTTADDQMQGLWALHRYLKAAAEITEPDCIASRLPQDAFPLTHDWVRRYEPKELARAICDTGIDFLLCRSSLVALVTISEAALMRFNTHLANLGYVQKCSTKNKNLLNWAFGLMRGATCGSPEMLSRLPQTCGDLDHARRLRNCIVHNNGCYNARMYIADAIDNGWVQVQGMSDSCRAVAAKEPIFLVTDHYEHFSRSHIEFLHILHNSIQHRSLGMQTITITRVRRSGSNGPVFSAADGMLRCECDVARRREMEAADNTAKVARVIVPGMNVIQHPRPSQTGLERDTPATLVEFAKTLNQMVTYKHTSVTSKKGINFVRSTVEDAGSLFHKIEQENDLGIDALFELVREGKPLNKQIAVQIKSGQSYYNSTNCECLIPIESHRTYWSSHPLPVVGIVYIPTLKRAHWVDIKSYLKGFPEATVIRYLASEANRLDTCTFSRLFVPTVLREVPELSFPEAFALFRSSKADERYLGLIVLFRRYPNTREVWDEFIQYFISKPPSEIPPIMIYFLAHVPGHGDIYYVGETLSNETRCYARELLARFGREEVIKLLGFIDEESGISRGSLGQSVEAIVSSLPRAVPILQAIVVDETVDDFRRDCAGIILAIDQQAAALPSLQRLAQSGSWYAQELVKHIKEHGFFDPY